MEQQNSDVFSFFTNIQVYILSMKIEEQVELLNDCFLALSKSASTKRPSINIHSLFSMMPLTNAPGADGSATISAAVANRRSS